MTSFYKRNVVIWLQSSNYIKYIDRENIKPKMKILYFQ
jgi:hypothetical protein